jgi:hypothetical protein
MRNTFAIAGVLLAASIGCEGLPGSRESQGAVLGGVVGGATGAAVHRENRMLGALVGGALGAAGGYVIGAKTDWFDDPDRARETQAAIEDAQRSPATVDEVWGSSTADLDDDGFVTVDELTALDRAGLNDEQILDRLEATGQIFELSRAQQQTLLEAGVSRRVVAEMPEINRDRREEILGRS